MPTAFSLPSSGRENHSSSAPQKTPSVHVRGTGYERGLTTGRAFKDLIQSRISADVTLQQALVPFYGTEEGRTLSEDLFRTNRYCPPQLKSNPHIEGANTRRTYSSVRTSLMRNNDIYYHIDSDGTQTSIWEMQCHYETL